MTPRFSLRARSRSRGIGLIEVLVAMFILAIGVLGAAAMQMNALKFNQIASARSQAAITAYEIVDRMRANRAAALAGDYDFTTLGAAAPTGTTVAARDMNEWLTNLSRRLPDGQGTVVRNGTAFTITVAWDEGRLGLADDTSTTVNERQGQFVFVTGL